MNIADWIALAGVVVAGFTLWAGAYYHVVGKLSAHAAKLDEKIDKVKEDYMRRDDFAGHLARLEAGQADLSREVRALTVTIAPAIADLAKAALAFKER